MLEIENKNLLEESPTDFRKLHILVWAGLSRPSPQGTNTVDISKLLVSRDSTSPADDKSNSSTALSSTARATTNTTPGPPASFIKEIDVSSYSKATQNLLKPPPPPATSDALSLPPQLPPVSSLQPGPLLQPSLHQAAQPYVPPASHYYSAPPPTQPSSAYPSQSLPPLSASIPSIPQSFPTSIQPAQPSGLSSAIPAKRLAVESSGHDASPPHKKHHGKWTPEEDAIAIELRRRKVKWDDIAKQIPGRSAISCRLRYQNYSEKRPQWDEEKKNKLARLYNRFKAEMWEMVASELGLPWRAVEAMHWQMGAEDMAARANERVFQPQSSSSTRVPRSPPSGSSGGETSSPMQLNPPRSRRSNSAPMNRRRNGSDSSTMNDSTRRQSALPSVSESQHNSVMGSSTAVEDPSANELYAATPSPHGDYSEQSTEHDRQLRGSLSSASGSVKKENPGSSVKGETSV